MNRSLLGRVILALAAATPATCGTPTSFRVPGGGMEPNIESGQTIQLDRQAYLRAADVRRGDVVVFRVPSAERLFVKRVVGLPGERVRVEDGRVSINGVPVPLAVEGAFAKENGDSASYRVLLASPCATASDVVVPTDAFFLLGDNRCASRDSRDFGSVTFVAIQGKVVLPE